MNFHFGFTLVNALTRTRCAARAPTVNILKLDGKATLELSLWINDAGKKNQVVRDSVKAGK